MALITSFSRQYRDRYATHKPVGANYYILGDEEAKIIQIDTTGAADRQIPGKLSQTIQLDKRTAQQLFQIMKEEFGFT